MSAQPNRGKNFTDNIRALGQVRSKQARLVISVPALLFCFTLLITLIVRFNIQEISNTEMDPFRREELQALGDLVLYLGLAGSIAAGCLGALLAIQIVRPVQLLHNSIKKVARGDLSHKANISQLAEIGSLGSAFNDMVYELHNIFEQRDRQMRDAAIGTVLTIDGYGNVLSSDSSLQKVLKISSDLIVGKNLIKCIRSEYLTQFDSDLDGILETAISSARKDLMRLETVESVDRESGQMSRLSVKVSPMDSDDKKAPAAVIDIRDLTTLKGFYEQIQRADRLATVGTLATGIAHEIRNPLGSIKGMTQLIEEDLARDGNDSPHIDYLQRIRKETDRLNKLVGGIMDFARTEPGPTVEIDLNELLRSTFETARHRVDFGDKDFPEIEWRLDRQLPTIPLEENRLDQAFLNLMINALEELRQMPGRMVISTCLDEQRRKRKVCLKIANTGNPIHKELKEKIFEPFFTTKAEGTGLGLPIAFQIIVTNNGALDFEYEDGMVVVCVRFPLRGIEEESIGESSQIIPKQLI